MSKQLVYRPYHIITKHECMLHVVDSFGAIVHRLVLPEWEYIRFFELTDNRFAIFFATPGRLERWLHIYESTKFELLKDIHFTTSVLSLIQLRATKQIVILTVAQGFHIYSEKLEFEQQFNHDGVLVECLCELEDGIMVTATHDYYLHFWCSKKWTKLTSMKIKPTFDDDEMNNRNQLHRVVYWPEQTILMAITENSFTLYDLEQKLWQHWICLDPDKDNHPILLESNFLFRYGCFFDVRLCTSEEMLFMKQLLHYSEGVRLPDRRVLLQTKNHLVEYTVNGEEFTKVRTRQNMNEFRFMFAFQTKQDNDLLINRLDPFVQLAIPILDLRMIIYEFI